MRIHSTHVFVLAALIAAAIAAPAALPLHASQKDDNPGQGLAHRDDPCDQLPDPRGHARGHDKKCAVGGSSSGVAKGDFNGDGFADLAIGEGSQAYAHFGAAMY